MKQLSGLIRMRSCIRAQSCWCMALLPASPMLPFLFPRRRASTRHPLSTSRQAPEGRGRRPTPTGRGGQCPPPIVGADLDASRSTTSARTRLCAPALVQIRHVSDRLPSISGTAPLAPPRWGFVMPAVRILDNVSSTPTPMSSRSRSGAGPLPPLAPPLHGPWIPPRPGASARHPHS